MARSSRKAGNPEVRRAVWRSRKVRVAAKVVACAHISAREDSSRESNLSAAEPRKRIVGMCSCLRLLGLLSGRSHGSASASEALDVLLFLLSGLEDLRAHRVSYGTHTTGQNAKGETNLERAEQALVNAHHSTGVVEFAAVIRRAE